MAGIKSNKKLKAKDLLDTFTVGYHGPSTSHGFRHFVNTNRPVFHRAIYIPQMLRDPRVSFGIKLIKGPILSKARFKINTDNEEVRKYLIQQVTRYWVKGAPIALDNIIYGYSGSEIIFKFDNNENLYGFFGLKHLAAADIKPIVSKTDDSISHMLVKRIKNRGKIYVPRPKFLWTIHERTHNRLFGKSRLEGAFIPWFEQWMPRGYRSIRQMWFYKNAFTSCAIRYPQGSTKDKEGAQVPNVILAEEIADRSVTGSTVILPKSPDGDNDWEYEPGKGIPVPDGLLEYGEVLGDEIWEGLGIPPEVVSADGTGAFAGRRVPQQAFYSVLQEIIDEHIIDVDEQIFRPLVHLNYGPIDYEIETISLLQTLQEEEMGLITGKVPGQEQDEDIPDEQMGTPNSGKIEMRSTNENNRREQGIKKNAQPAA